MTTSSVSQPSIPQSEQSQRAAANTIKPRRMAFDLDEPLGQFAFANNSLISTFFYALSAMFPDGERFFIHSVRNYQNKIEDPVLQEQIRGFIGQEAHHGVSHQALNDAIAKMGFPMAKLVENLDVRINFLKTRLGYKRQLAITVAMEHFTAALAEFLLTNPQVFENVHPTIRNMLIWHAVEEIEHKAVAFDVYRQQVNNEALRKRVMVISIVHLFGRIAVYQYRLLKAVKHFPSWQEWKEATRFFWGKRGILRANLGSMKQFFRTGFHPWDIDQRELIADWQQRFPEVAALQVG